MGILFSNLLSDATVVRNRLAESGSGVALGDVDGDGWVDMYFCGLDGDNVLYRNLGGWKFEDITTSAGVACPNQLSTGCAFADVDGDEDLDLLVNSLGGGTRLFLNDGRGHFTEMIAEWPARRFGATSMALADVDGDGDLDLYVTNYRTDTFQDNPPNLRITTRRLPDGSAVVEPSDRFLGLRTPAGRLEILEKGEADFLYINRGAGHFFPVRWDVGVFLDEDGSPLTEPPRDWGLSVMFRDLNGDGLPDLYVCNDFVNWPDRVWLNQGGKRFRAAPRNAFRCFSLSSMAVDVADINRDGHMDIFVAEMLNPRREYRAWHRPDMLSGTVVWPVSDPNFRPELPHNTLHLSRGDGTFAEIARLAGIAATDWTWSAAFLDVDLDGWEDLLVATGNNHDVQDLDVLTETARTTGWKTPEARSKNLARLPRRETACMAFRNRHDLTFEDAGAKWNFNVPGVAHGMAFADLDNDGDLDVVMNCLNEPARVFRNETAAPRIAIRLKGSPANTRGIGAKITVRGGPVTQTQEMIAGGRYCSSDDPMRVFAAGSAAALEIEVVWRSGRRSVVKGAIPNCVYEIDEAASQQTDEPATPPTPARFEEVALTHRVEPDEMPFDDFARQPLLPAKLSTPGPGIAWMDLNGDGKEDLLIGAFKGGRGALWHNTASGKFMEPEALLPVPTMRAQASILAWRDESGARLLTGESNWEEAVPGAPFAQVYPLTSNTPAIHLPKLGDGLDAVGPLSMADIDGDGDLDLFVGGRARAGRFPEAASSFLLRQEGNAFTVAQEFPGLGLVSGAVFTDFDGDGDPDLALACQWDSLRLFRNDGGKFIEATSHFGLQRFTGRWNGITAADFDGDGRLDLVATNWGRNWRTDEPTGLQIPVELYYGNFAGDGGVQTLLASLDPNSGKVTPWRDRNSVATAIPSVAARFPTHHAYGRAGIAELLGDPFSSARVLRAEAFDSMVFLNRGDHFEPHPLPIEAQFSVAFGVSAADFDGDGNEDLFLAQNFFETDAETSRQDAGTGLVLLGNGRGDFRALPPKESGIRIDGAQRGAAAADFDHDGRMDIAVTQHHGPVKLFHNRAGKPGVRVTLRGDKKNPSAIGAVARLRTGGRLGSAHELHLGNGYWSQDATVLVLTVPESPEAVWVRWPGGREEEFPWPSGINEAALSKGHGLAPLSTRK